MVRRKEHREIPTRLLLRTGKHPRGVKPLGNQLMETRGPNYVDTRSSGLGTLSVLPDSILFQILGDLSGPQLGLLACCSKVLYCFSCHDEFWKPLTLRDFPQFQWIGKTWRETYYYNWMNSQNKKLEVVHGDPIVVKNFYSDVLFQSWFCTSIGILDEWLQTDNIDRVSNLSADDFKRLYESRNKPVVISDAMKDWKALGKWSPEYLCSIYGQTVFRAEAMDTPLSNYFKYAKSTLDETPMYLFDKFFSNNCPDLMKDYAVPEQFQEDLFSVLGNDRPDFRWIIIGPAKSGSSFHKDPNATSAWNATITGSKKWIMFPPDIIPPGVIPSGDGSVVTTPASIIEWFVHFYRQAHKLSPVECITRAGDLIFVPSGWWHCVINLETTIAITQNYVSECNLENVMEFVNGKTDQVSGLCEGHDTLGLRFMAALEEKYPGKFNSLKRKFGKSSQDDQDHDAGDTGEKCAKQKPFWQSLSNNSGSPFSFQLFQKDNLELE